MLLAVMDKLLKDGNQFRSGLAVVQMYRCRPRRAAKHLQLRQSQWTKVIETQRDIIALDCSTRAAEHASITTARI
jgi:hypothetical protein